MEVFEADGPPTVDVAPDEAEAPVEALAAALVEVVTGDVDDDVGEPDVDVALLREETDGSDDESELCPHAVSVTHAAIEQAAIPQVSFMPSS